MKATAIANANIALVKYWGKRDSSLILPYNGSISMNCSGLEARTTVEFGDFGKDEIIINDKVLQKDEKDFLGSLDRIRALAGIRKGARVVCEINFPVAAGLASSAAGLASGIMAAVEAAGLEMGERELTILARKCSGSACRSIPEGFVEWFRGKQEDGLDSYAQTIARPDYWPEFRIMACVVSEKQKPVSSRAGMSQSVETSPYYKEWVSSATKDLDIIRGGIRARDFPGVGSAAEWNCLKMHAIMMTTVPPIIYWTPETLEVMHAVRSWRDEGLECYFTIDAGPQVKVMYLEESQKELEKRLNRLEGVIKTIVCRPGEGAKLTGEHLF